MTFDDICAQVYNIIGSKSCTTSNLLDLSSELGLTRQQVRGALWCLFNDGKIHISDKWVVTRIT